MVKTFMIVSDEKMVQQVRSLLSQLTRAGATAIEVPGDSAGDVLAMVAKSLVTGIVEPSAAPVQEEAPKRASTKPPPKRAASGTRLKATSSHAASGPHAHHSWTDESPGLSHCVKCGMYRETLDKGVFSFMDRDGRVVERPPFGGPTPKCDEALARRAKYISRAG